MLRDNLAGLIEPMINRAGAHPLGGHPKQGPTGGCSRSTELTIVVLKRSWRQNFHWKTGRWAEKAKCSGFEVTTAARDSRAVGTALHQSHRTIDPQCLKKSPPRRGGIYALTKNVPSPFRAEPTHHCNELGHNVLPLEPKTVRDKSLKTYSEVSRFSADDSLDRSIEPWKSFGWNPVFDVRGRPDSMHLVIAKVRIAHNERGVFLFSKVTTHTLELGR